jgi:hypothetical protein
MISDQKKTADQHRRTKHKMFSDQKKTVDQHTRTKYKMFSDKKTVDQHSRTKHKMFSYQKKAVDQHARTKHKIFSYQKKTENQHTRTKHKLFSDQKETADQHPGKNSTIPFPVYHTGFKLAAQSTFISLAPSINIFAKKYFPGHTHAFLFKLCVFERQKYAGCLCYTLACWAGLMTDEGKKRIRRGGVLLP